MENKHQQLVKKRKFNRKRRYLPNIALCITVALGIGMLFPATAHAGFLDMVFDIEGWINKMLTGACESFLNAFLAFMRGINIESTLTAPFQDMLGTNATGATTVYTIAKDIHQLAVVPVAHSILALVMLVQLVKISQKIDAHASLPAVKEVVFLAVFFVIFTWLINNSADLCVAVYDSVNEIAKRIVDPNAVQMSISLGDTSGATVGNMLMILLLTVVAWVMGAIAYVTSFFVAYARAIQLYVMMAFSPIPFSLMGFEETKSFGVNFCKNFIALCLASCIMIFIMIAFPLIISGFFADLTLMASDDGTLTLIKVLAVCLLLIVGLFKSGGWAKDILGG